MATSTEQIRAGIANACPEGPARGARFLSNAGLEVIRTGRQPAPEPSRDSVNRPDPDAVLRGAARA